VPGGAVTADPVNLGTEAQLVTATDTASRAAHLLNTSTPPGQLVTAVSVDQVSGTSVLVVHYLADSAGGAQAGARAFAEAYLDQRAALAQAALSDLRARVAGNLADANAQLASVNARINQLPVGSSELADLRGTRGSLSDQITTLSGRMNDLAAVVVTPGQVIQDADRPSAPVRGLGWALLVAGPFAGFLGGLGGAVGWEALRPRVRDGDDITGRAGVPVLAELDDGEAELHSATTETGRDYHRLRNVVTAALTVRDKVVLVTGVSPGPGSTIVAANVAAALARVGHDVVLLGANPPAIGPNPVLLSQLFDISDVPGLTDVLSGRTDLGYALQVPPREPRLRVVAPGGTASASRLLQSATAQTMVHGLRTLARYVLIDSPSPAVDADAQSLASLADAAIVVAEAGYARHTEVSDAVAQLAAVGTRVLGAVVLPRAEPLVSPGPADEPVSGAGWTWLQVQPDGRVVRTPIEEPADQ
jgi:Mrp family chromosome partitioning ATPase